MPSIIEFSAFVDQAITEERHCDKIYHYLRAAWSRKVGASPFRQTFFFGPTVNDPIKPPGYLTTLTMPTLYPGVALVTGAASGTSDYTIRILPYLVVVISNRSHRYRTLGIGQAVATSFAREGCTRIAIADLSEDGLRATEKLIQEASPSPQDLKVKVQRINVLNENEVGDLLESTVDLFGRVDYAVNCAGVIGSGDPSHSMSVEDFDRTNGINYRGCWLSSRAEIQQMRGQEPLESHDGRPGGRGAIGMFAGFALLLVRARHRVADMWCSSQHRKPARYSRPTGLA